MRVRELRQVLSDGLENVGMVQTYDEIDKLTLDDGLQCMIGNQCFHITITEQW